MIFPDWMQRALCGFVPGYELWVRRVPKQFRGGGAVGVVTRGHTGRQSSTSLEDRLAQEWARTGSAIRRRFHTGSCHFHQHLLKVASVEGEPLRCFRGRLDDGSIESWENMGPPPTERTPEGRYNARRRPVLYLSTSREAALLETQRGKDHPTFLQEYALPLQDLRIADFAASTAPEYIHSVFDITESACVDGRTGLDDCTFGHLVATLTAGTGFDGMVVCGVLGSRGLQYRNVVMFRPTDRWRGWSLRDKGFASSGSGLGPCSFSDSSGPSAPG